MNVSAAETVDLSRDHPRPLGGGPDEDARVLWRVARLSLRYPWRTGMGLASALAAAGFQVLVPQYFGQAVDHAHRLLGADGRAEAESALLITALMLLGASLARGLFTMAHNYLGEDVGQRIGYALRLQYYEKLQRLSFAFHDRVHSGDLMTRGMLDLEGVRMFVNTVLMRAALLVFLIGLGAALVLSSHLQLGLLSLSYAPFVAWRTSIVHLTLRRSWLLLQEKLSVVSRIMEENMGGVRVVRAFAAQPHEMAKFDQASDAALALAKRRIGSRVRESTAMSLAFYGAMGLVLWFGGQAVLAGEISIGKLAEILAFMTILQTPVRQIGLLINGSSRAATCGARLFEVLDLPSEVADRPGAAALRPGIGVLRFEDVSFTYPGQARPALDGVSLEVRPGHALGIVGPPGSGKSTIAHLIPRFYDPTAGRITLDGQDIKWVTLASLRHAVGVVQQDAFLFKAPIDANIAYGDPWADRARIADASGAAQLHDFVARLPHGYDTLVGERGVSLSGGQRQRLTIARTVLLAPSVVVFDDSTASVDAATESRIHAAIKALAKTRAVVIISHRLGTLMRADEIVFLDGGRIVERGSHAELMAAGGRYQALFDLQAHGR